MAVLEFLELFITIYSLYSLNVFATCLQQGKIAEYEPKKKFYWFAFLVIALVI